MNGSQDTTPSTTHPSSTADTSQSSIPTTTTPVLGSPLIGTLPSPPVDLPIISDSTGNTGTPPAK